jgi:hypothetical protein
VLSPRMAIFQRRTLRSQRLFLATIDSGRRSALGTNAPSGDVAAMSAIGSAAVMQTCPACRSITCHCANLSAPGSNVTDPRRFSITNGLPSLCSRARADKRRHPMGSRTKGSAFIVKNVIYPVEAQSISIEWLKQGEWQTTSLPTRPEYLIRAGNGHPMRPFRAVLELQAPYLAEVGV